MTLKRYRSLWNLCTSLGLLLAVFLAPLHWLLIVATILVAWGGPLVVDIAWDVTHRNLTPQTISRETVQPRTELSHPKRPKWFTDEYMFNIGTGAMWLSTLVALFEPPDTIWLLFLGFGIPLMIYVLKGFAIIRRNSVR